MHRKLVLLPNPTRLARSLHIRFSSKKSCLNRYEQVSSRGVDSVGSGFANPAIVVRDLARRRGEARTKKTESTKLMSAAAAIVVLTGATDYLSDGEIVLKSSNGHPMVRIPQSHVIISQHANGCFWHSLAISPVQVV